MPDIALSVQLSRDALGLNPLEIAFGARYYLAPQFLGGAVQWNRQKISSPFVDGEITTQRSRQNVTENVGVEIRATNASDLQAYTVELIAAFLQDSYTMTVVADGATFIYQCETADYQAASWSTPRMVAFQGQLVFQVPRQPVALAGGY